MAQNFYVAPSGLELFLPPVCWDYRYTPTTPSNALIFTLALVNYLENRNENLYLKEETRAQMMGWDPTGSSSLAINSFIEQADGWNNTSGCGVDAVK